MEPNAINVCFLLQEGLVPFANLCVAIRKTYDREYGTEETCLECGRRTMATNDGTGGKTVVVAITPGQERKVCPAKAYLERSLG